MNTCAPAMTLAELQLLLNNNPQLQADYWTYCQAVVQLVLRHTQQSLNPRLRCAPLLWDRAPALAQSLKHAWECVQLDGLLPEPDALYVPDARGLLQPVTYWFLPPSGREVLIPDWSSKQEILQRVMSVYNNEPGEMYTPLYLSSRYSILMVQSAETTQMRFLVVASSLASSPHQVIKSYNSEEEFARFVTEAACWSGHPHHEGCKILQLLQWGTIIR